MAISDELNRIIQAKADIRSALEEKGLTIGDSSKLNEYPALIQNMQTGGGDTSTLISLVEREVQTIDIPAGTVKIGNNSFTGCNRLRNITIPNTVTFIAAGAFNYCGVLNHLIIPNSVLSIGQKVFYQNSQLNDLVILKNTPPTLDSENVFNNSLKIYVKNAAVDSYKNAGGNWNNVSTYITPLAAIDYDSTAYTVTASGRDNVELYVDASLINSSVYTFTPDSIDVSHNITVKSVDPSLGVLDTSTMEVLVEGISQVPSATPTIRFEEEEIEQEVIDEATGEPTGETETVGTGNFRAIGEISNGGTQYVTLNVNDNPDNNPTGYDFMDSYETTSDDPDITITIIATATEPGKSATSITKYYTEITPEEGE